MLYAIMGVDTKGSLPARQKARPAHLARLERLKQEGRLLLAGPHPAIDSEDPGEAGFSGSLIIAEFADLTEARAWAEADPYTIEGVFEAVNVLPFKRVLP